MDTADDPDIPIYLLPGLNGDPRVFAPQIEAFPTAKVITWPAPMACESLAAYAKRIALSLDSEKDCIVAGVSFGGFVAMEVSRRLGARACLVLASSRDVRGLPIKIRLLRPLAALLPPASLRWAVGMGWSIAAFSPRFKRRIRRLSEPERNIRRWALQALLTWRPTGEPPCLVFQIHGGHDAEFPAGREFAEWVIPHAGHLLTLTHGETVNAFFREAIRLSATQGC